MAVTMDWLELGEVIYYDLFSKTPILINTAWPATWDVAQKMERNKAAAKQNQVRPSNQLYLSLPPFPV